MKVLFNCILVCLLLSVALAAQERDRFPGLSAQDALVLREAKKVTPIALPKWLPAGFKTEKIIAMLGSEVAIEDKALVIVYSRKLLGGTTQRFAIEAGFEGLGDLPYDTTSTVNSAIGNIYIAYQPRDPDNRLKTLKDFSMTQWFDVGKTAYHYDGMYEMQSGNKPTAMISLSDTKKILGSLARF